MEEYAERIIEVETADGIAAFSAKAFRGVVPCDRGCAIYVDGLPVIYALSDPRRVLQAIYVGVSVKMVSIERHGQKLVDEQAHQDVGPAKPGGRPGIAKTIEDVDLSKVKGRIIGRVTMARDGESVTIHLSEQTGTVPRDGQRAIARMDIKAPLNEQIEAHRDVLTRLPVSLYRVDPAGLGRFVGESLQDWAKERIPGLAVTLG